MPPSSEMNDHDLLVTLHQQMKQVSIDIADLKNNTATTIADHERRLRMIEDNYLSKKNYTDAHNELVTEVRVLYKYLYMGFGALGLLQMILTYFIKIKQ